MDDEDNYRDDILGRKKSHIVDDEDDDDVYDDNDDDDDDDNEDDEDDDQDDNVATNDLDDDKVEFVGKPPNDSPPGTNDSLAFAFQKGYNPSRRQLKKRHKKGGEKRSGSNVVNVAWGCNLPPPPPSTGQEQEQEQIEQCHGQAGEQGSIPLPGGEEEEWIERCHGRAGGVESLHPPLKVKEEVIHNRLSVTRGQIKGRQKRGASLHFSPPLRAGSVVIQVQTPLVPVVPRMIPLQLPNPLNLPNLIV
jgi:hypothetical protein